MNNNTSTHSTLGGGEEPSGRLLHIYNNKRTENGVPTLKRSISRNTLLSSNSVPPTRPLFNNNNNNHHKSLPIEAQQQRVLTVENAIFPENQPPLFQNDSNNHTITKRSSSTPVMVTSTVKFRISPLDKQINNKLSIYRVILVVSFLGVNQQGQIIIKDNKKRKQ